MYAPGDFAATLATYSLMYQPLIDQDGGFVLPKSLNNATSHLRDGKQEEVARDIE
jgi:hypothetical protein